MEKNRLRNNIIASGGFVLFSAYMLFFAIAREISVEKMLGSSMATIDSRFFPYLTTALIGVLALAELMSSSIKYLRLRKEETGRDAVAENIPRALVLFVLFLVYAVMFQYWGFIAATVCIPPIVMFIMGSRKWYHYVSFYGVAAVTYFLFVHALNIVL